MKNRSAPVVPFLFASVSGTALAQTELYSTEGEDMGAFGWSVKMTDDIDGDGHADIAVGAPWSDNDGGRAYVLSGFDGSIHYTFFGDGFPNRLGESVSGAGDVDGNGVEDVIVGAINRAGIVGFTGYARIYAGEDGSEIRTLSGFGPGDTFGKSVAGIGDIDNDGFPDVAVGASELWIGGAGSVEIFSGMDGTKMLRVEGLAILDQFGYDVDSAGDFNADGVQDFIVGGPELVVPTVGYSVIISGKDAFDYGSPTIPLSDPGVMASDIVVFAAGGDSLFGLFGTSVDVIGDVNNDGTDDVLVGGPFANPAGMMSGRARLISGFDGAPIRSHDGSAGFDQYGHGVTGAGDLDGDDVPDYIVGGKQSQGWSFAPEIGSGAGYAEAYSGDDGSFLFPLVGPGFNSLFGFAMDGGGDVNGDGAPDFAISAPFDAGMMGVVFVYTGDTAISDYGDGCPGSGGFVPALSMSCSPVPYGPLGLKVTGGLGGAATLIAVGTGAGDLPFAGCSLLISPIPTQPQLGLTLLGSAPGAGTGSLDTTLPSGVVSGTTLAFQGFVVDPGAPATVSATNGCLLTIP